MVFGKKKPTDTLEEDQVRTEDACEVAALLNEVVTKLDQSRKQAVDLKAELETKSQKYKQMISQLDNAEVTLSSFLEALKKGKKETWPQPKAEEA